jgi:hypothetical protein
MQEKLPDTPRRKRKAARQSRNVRKVIASFTLRGRNIIIANIRSLKMFQAEAKWEMSDKMITCL